MKSISYWASTHILLARCIIVVGHILLFLLASLLQQLLAFLHIQLPDTLLAIVCTVTICICFLYPTKNTTSKTYSQTYGLRKTFDFVLLCCSFVCMMMSFSNDNHLVFSNEVSGSINVSNPVVYKYPQSEQLVKALKVNSKTKLTVKEKKVLRKEMKFQIKELADSIKAGNKENTNAALEIIFIILLALGLLFLLSVLSCAIACGGAETLAAIVVLVGLAGIIWLAVVLIKNVQKKYNKIPSIPSAKRSALASDFAIN